MLALVTTAGCDPQSLLNNDAGAANAPPPPDQPALASSATSTSPPPTFLPEAVPVEPAPPTPLEIAETLLPPRAPGVRIDLVHGNVVWRVLEVRNTPAGVAVQFAIVSIGADEPPGLTIGGLLTDGGTTYPVTAILIGDGVVSGGVIPESLPADTPLIVWGIWVHPHPFHISGIRGIGVTRQSETLSFRDCPVTSQTEVLSSSDAAATVALLQAHCSPASPGTAFWTRGTESGSVAVRLTSISADGGPLAGEFFVPHDPAATKQFEGELTRDPETGTLSGTLRTIRRSGVRGRPTAGPSTWNLLLRDSYAEYSVRIVGPELYGRSDDNFALSITALPAPPHVELQRE